MVILELGRVFDGLHGPSPINQSPPLDHHSALSDLCCRYKNAIKDGSVKERIDEIKLAQVLVLDDIGAEQHSPWVRDDVLQVILQYRMQENLPTFFTSNFSFDELERHFASGKSGDETWQAQRVMERIRYLARDLHLKGNNRR